MKLQFIGVIDGKVRLLLSTESGPMPVDLGRVEALTLAGKIEAAAESLPGSELPAEPIFMRVTLPNQD